MVRRILIDLGSAVNIIPKSMLNQMCIVESHIWLTDIVITGFDQHSQVPLGTVTLWVTMNSFVGHWLTFM